MKAAAFPVVIEPLQTVDDQFLDNLAALIVAIQNINYASPVARSLQELYCDLVVLQFRETTPLLSPDAPKLLTVGESEVTKYRSDGVLVGEVL